MGRGHLIIAFFFAATDSLYWLWEMIYHLQLVPPKDPVGPGTLKVWIRAVICGVGGIAGAYALTQLGGTTELLTVLAGAYMGGRFVGGAMASFAR